MSAENAMNCEGIEVMNRTPYAGPSRADAGYGSPDTSLECAVIGMPLHDAMTSVPHSIG